MSVNMLMSNDYAYLQARIVADAYSLNVNWGDVVFDKAIKDGCIDYVTDMADAKHLTTDVFRAVADRYLFFVFTHFSCHRFKILIL